MKVAFIFTHPPYGSSKVREGLDALLAMSAYCDENEVAVFFWNDGILSLLKQQQADAVLQKDTAAMSKLLMLYEVEQCFVCEEDLQRYQCSKEALSLPVVVLDNENFFKRLQQAEKILTF
ncbi:sulfurtransferase complex subunit TusC [Gallibacterium anatis]|uniref:sulfurtransferase complex subunit TusC n=1 Tax=Gallibacterium anatis TaxID=750 RepID=UPI000531EEFC|nr:sulfurtransferase complex subunit TusC [Gallibacterium anatis]KGQ66868.1 sulfur relay protein TusC [Gallibacterium anatis]